LPLKPTPKQQEQVVKVDVESEEEEEEDNNYRDQTQNDDSVDAIETEEEEYEDESSEIVIPKGWKSGQSKCKRKFFFNEYNKDKWYLNHDTNGKHYFYNADHQSVWELPSLFFNNNNNTEKTKAQEAEDKSQFRQKLDQDLPTFKNFFNRLSMRKNSKEAIDELKRPPLLDDESQQSVVSESDSKLSNGNRMTTSTTVSYSHKPPSDLNSVFKCIVLEKIGKKCKKKNTETYRVTLASTKLLFVKDSKTPKLEFFVDFKGGKCYKVVKMAKDDTNNVKEKSDIVDMVNGNSSKTKKSAFVLETLTGYKIVIMNESEALINDWHSAINSIILQFQSEFSPIYQGPEHLHSTQLLSSSLQMSYISKSNIKKAEPENENTKFSLFTKLSNNNMNVKAITLTKPRLPTNMPPPPADSPLIMERNFIIKYLNYFLNRRPTLEQLKKQGIIQG
jgi:hypothetical protein